MQGEILPPKEDGLITIELTPDRQGCDACATRGICKLPDFEHLEVPASRLPPGVGPGDWVQVELPPGHRLWLSFSLFILPLLLLLGGALLGSRHGEGWAVMTGFCGLLLGLLFNVLRHRRPVAVSRIHITRC